MNPDDIIFTATNINRDITYTLKEGHPDIFGKQHIEEKHAILKGKMGAVKKAVESTESAFKDTRHPERERIYCFGADESHPAMYVKVIAEYNTDKTANIITAWLTPEISSTEGEITYVRTKF